MPRAWCLIREQPHYRRDAFAAGLKAAGWRVECRAPASYAPGDLVVVWNRYGRFAAAADACAAAGGRALICENGYLGADSDGRQLYAIAEGGHNGSGRWFAGGVERWAALGIKIKPWRDASKNADGHVLLCAQRGIGSPLMASPPGWEDEVVRELRKYTSRELRLRRHPEDRRQPPPAGQRSLAEDLAGAWACVVWSSGAANHALVAGIPAFATAPHHVARPAVSEHLERIESAELPERLPSLTRLAWAQWRIDEIAAGHPFRVNGWAPRHVGEKRRSA